MDVITIRTLEVARRFPQELPHAPSRERGEPQRCAEHGCALEPVLVTTYGDFGAPEVWRAYPLAMDAWRCSAGDHLELGAFLSAREVTDLVARGTSAASRGELDEAEYHLRRVVSAWPGYFLGRVNLGSVYLDRVKAAQAAGASREQVRDLVAVAAAQFEQALASDPPAPPQVRVMLGRIYLRSGREADARAQLEAVLADAGASAIHAQARALLTEVGPPVPPAPAGVRFEHPYLELTLPPGWTRVPEPDGLTALFEGPEHEIVNVVVMEGPAPRDAAADVESLMRGHEASIRGNYASCDAAAPRVTTHASHVEAERQFQVRGAGAPWHIFARYAASRPAMQLRDGREVHAVLQIVYYGSAWQPSEAVVRAVAQARLVPRLQQLVAG